MSARHASTAARAMVVAGGIPHHDQAGIELGEEPHHVEEAAASAQMLEVGRADVLVRVTAKPAQAHVELPASCRDLLHRRDTGCGEHASAAKCPCTRMQA